jgi:hypothetical protein
MPMEGFKAFANTRGWPIKRYQAMADVAEERYLASMAKLRLRPLFEEAHDKAKVDFTNIAARETTYGTPLRFEEGFTTGVAMMIPGVRQSMIAFSGNLNWDRMMLYEHLRKDWTRRNPTAEELKELGHAVNVKFGRIGSTGGYGQALAVLSHVFFSPRWVASRVLEATGEPIWGGAIRAKSPKLAWVLTKELVREAIGLGTLYTFAASLGASVGDDPDDARFGKIIIGDHVIDPTAGIASLYTLLARLWPGGENPPNEYADTQIWANFVKGKLTPPISLIRHLKTGQDIRGQEIPKTELGPIKSRSLTSVLRIFSPLVLRDLKEAVEQAGWTMGGLMGVLSFLGFGVQTYTRRSSGRSGLGVPKIRSLRL